VVQHPVSLAEILHPPGEVAVAFFCGLVHASGRSGVAGVPAGADKATVLQVTEEAVDRAGVNRILFKAKRVQTIYEFVPVDFVTMYEQHQTWFQETVDVPRTCLCYFSRLPPAMATRHDFHLLKRPEISAICI
jgi:hypothetical protein